MDEDALKQAKTDRRTAKSAFTRVGKSLAYTVDHERPPDEVRQALAKLEVVYEALVCKHEEYAALIEDDEAYEKEEEWLADCQHTFMKLEVDAKMFIESKKQPGSNDLDVNGDLNKGKESASSHVDKQGISSMQSVTPSEDNDSSGMTVPQSVGQALPATGNLEVINTVQTADDLQSQETNSVNNATQIACTEQSTIQTGACTFKLEKPKLPAFAGNVRDYAIFRSDFKHAIEAKHTKRDAITLLRTCLRDKPLELIKGIGSDYDAAWEYLDSIYGDPRFVSDTVTQDIMQFKALQDGEDARFCDLVHLVKRSYNTLKEVGLPSDMDNSHMLSIIEQKMCVDDRKVWARDLEREKKPATLHALMSWMTVEMKSRMRATAPIRVGPTQRRHINHVRADDNIPPCALARPMSEICSP